jgi:hypothetical protein
MLETEDCDVLQLKSSLGIKGVSTFISVYGWIKPELQKWFVMLEKKSENWDL